MSVRDAREDFIDAIEELGTDGLREAIGEVLDLIAKTRNGGAQHAYAGIKVPQSDEGRKQMTRSLTEALLEWAE